MASIKNIFTFAFNNTSIFSKNRLTFVGKNGASFQRITNTQIRYVSFYPLSKNIQYISKDPNMDIKVDQKTMKLNRPIERPLCYMFTWLYAKNPHIIKYANIYLEKGFDIFNVTCDPIQVMFPTIGTQPVARNVLKFMEQNTRYDPVVFQGFSVAGYMWGEVCKYASEDLPRYQPLIDRIICQVWDSVPDVSEFRIGVAKGQFPHNIFMQKLLYNYISLHLWVFHNIATKHYQISSKYFHNNLTRAPTLFLCSKTDPVGALESNWGFKTSWEKLGVKVDWKCFEDSPHIQHIHTYPKEYVKAVNDHLIANVPMLAHLKKD